MDILVDNERMKSIIEFWQKNYADAAKELEYSIKLRKQIQNDLLKSDRINDNLKAENERLKRENEILLGQLVINDGEDVTVQISKSQFDEYNKFRTCLQEIKAIAKDNIIGCFSDKCDLADEILQKITKAEEEWK